MLPEIRAAMPEGMKLELLSDQSRFVSASIHGVLTEGVIAASLTGLLILLFLGSWRSTLIVDDQHPAVDPGRDHRAARRWDRRSTS